VRWIEPSRPGELILPDRRLLRPRPRVPCYDRSIVPLQAAISLGASHHGAVGSGTSATTTGVTTQATGSGFWISVGLNNGRTYTVADNKSNTYTPLAAEFDWNSAGSSIRGYYVENGAGGAGHTATVTVSAGGATGITIFFAEILGGLTSGLLDGTPLQNEDTASPFTSSAFTNAQADELLIAMFIGDSGSNPATHTPGNSFVTATNCDVTDGTQFYTGCLMSRVVSSIAAYNTTLTETGAGRGATLIAGFKAAAGGGGGAGIDPNLRSISNLAAVNRGANF
jgi:hypothetical protein